MSVIPALQRQRQEDHEFKSSLGYIVKPCLKRKIEKKEKSGVHTFHTSMFMAY
jgi:hypothetical protein